MAHIGEEFCPGTVRACRGAYFFLGVRAVIVGAQDQQRCVYPFRPRQAEHKAVEADSCALFLEPRRVVQDLGVRHLCGEESLPRELRSADVWQRLTGD